MSAFPQPTPPDFVGPLVVQKLAGTLSLSSHSQHTPGPLTGGETS